jgi:hypothetical protein
MKAEMKFWRRVQATRLRIRWQLKQMSRPFTSGTLMNASAMDLQQWGPM